MKKDPFSVTTLKWVARTDKGRAWINIEREKMQALRNSAAADFSAQLARMDEALRNMDEALGEIPA